LQPLVSAVIPTRNRPLIVRRAVQSALAQTLRHIEVVVVIDGPDEDTRLELSTIDDPRLRIIELPLNAGAAAARNTGVDQAKGEWVAFLDDDDEWLPEKLEMQLKAFKHSQYASPIIGCHLIARTPRGEFVWPRRLPQPSEPLSEYLLARNSLFQGEGLIQTSTVFTRKVLLQAVPFKKGLKKHQDWDWLLRVSTLEGVGIEFVPKPLAIWYNEEDRKSINSTSNWQYSFSWIQENRNLVTPRAYAAFLMVEVASQASRSGDWKAFWLLLRESTRLGRPKFVDFKLYFALWLIPQGTRRWLRSRLAKERIV